LTALFVVAREPPLPFGPEENSVATLSSRLLLLVFLTSLCAPGQATAQTGVPNEAIAPDGSVTQDFVLTPAQREAIYNAIVRQNVRTSSRSIAAIVGAPVPPLTPLGDLPEAAPTNSTGGEALKYVMVDDDVFIVDPVKMQIVDVIHGPAIRHRGGG
jgi:hypothetical protein